MVRLMISGTEWVCFNRSQYAIFKYGDFIGPELNSTITEAVNMTTPIGQVNATSKLVFEAFRMLEPIILNPTIPLAWKLLFMLGVFAGLHSLFKLSNFSIKSVVFGFAYLYTILKMVKQKVKGEVVD